jgi:tRNA nucleotidyltransferase (CCA-adding enzyme)
MPRDVTIEAKVLARIRPSPAEEERLARVIRELTRTIAARLREEGWEAKPILVGSVAKGTHLTGAEVDLFVAFPPDLPRADLESRGLALGRILERGVRMYAEHPYTRGWYNGTEVEIVPCYRVADAAQRLSAVDRTPLHADYVLGRLKEDQADEVRLLKAWAEGIGVYGAEAKIRGFSGYLCELLVLRFGTFRGVLEASQGWRRGQLLEFDRSAGKPFEEDAFVVIDPIDANRNVASAVSVEQLATFVHAAREYLRGPSERFFFPRPLKPLPLARLKAHAKGQGGELLAVAIPLPKVTDDVLYPQLRKAHHALEDLLRRNGFPVHDSRHDVAGREALFLFRLGVGVLPRRMRHDGPPVWVRNARDFVEKWSGNPRTLAGPYIVGERWAVDIARAIVDPATLVRRMRRDLSLGKDLEKSARRALRPYVGTRALRPAYTHPWTRLFDKRFPWQR